MSLERRVLIWMCVLVAVNQLGFGGVVPSLPLYAKSFGVSASAIGLAIAVYGLARFVIAVPSGQLSDRLGRRPTLALGGLVSALGNFWCAAADGYPEFIIARFVAGAGAGLVLTTGQVVLADITRPAERGRTMAIYQGVFLFAVGVGPFPGGLLADHFGLAAPFWTYGVANLLVATLAWFTVAESRDLAHGGAARGRRERPAFIDQLRLLTEQLGFVLVSIISLMNAVARTGALFNIVPVLGSVRLALSVTEIGIGLALGSVLGLLVAYPAGMLVDHFGRKAVIVPATVISGASLLLFCVAPSYLWFTVACVLWGVASSIGGAAPAAYAADSAPAGMNAAAMSSFRMIGDFGYVIGPIALGLVVDVVSPESALVVAATLLIVVGLAFAKLAPETYRGRR
ncbi:MAG: MFS transporter [Alphaproteobacteria bacterium]|jgi:MFS family permease|nr:MFS transporter [Alphaproteobacteria bacterium]